MGIEEVKKSIEDTLKMSVDELKGALPSLFDQIKEVSIEKLIDAVPDLMPKMMAKMQEIDIGKFIIDAPEIFDKMIPNYARSLSIMT